MELWRDHHRFPNHEFSSHGNIRNKKTGHILRGIVNKDGYKVVSIGNVDNLIVHRLICEVFHGPPIGRRNQVNHIDSDRQNNRASNLEWVTPSENIKHGYLYGNLDPSIGLKRAIEVNKKAVRIVETGQIFESVKECADFLGIKTPNRLSRVLVGCRKGQCIHGYHLEFVEKED